MPGWEELAQLEKCPSCKHPCKSQCSSTTENLAQAMHSRLSVRGKERSKEATRHVDLWVLHACTYMHTCAHTSSIPTGSEILFNRTEEDQCWAVAIRVWQCEASFSTSALNPPTKMSLKLAITAYMLTARCEAHYNLMPSAGWHPWFTNVPSFGVSLF